MTKKTRKIFSSNFKAKVALEAIQGVKTLNEIGQEFEVHPVQVGKNARINNLYGRANFLLL